MVEDVQCFMETPLSSPHRQRGGGNGVAYLSAGSTHQALGEGSRLRTAVEPLE